MATLTFAYDHSRDPMHPGDLASRIANSLGLTFMPQVDINPTQIIVTAAGVGETSRTTIQALIDAYVINHAWDGLLDNNLSALQVRAATAIQTNIDALALPDPTAANNTYLAIGTPTNAQVVAQVRALTNQSNAVVAQLRALTRQNTALIRMLLGAVDSLDGA